MDELIRWLEESLAQRPPYLTNSEGVEPGDDDDFGETPLDDYGVEIVRVILGRARVLRGDTGGRMWPESRLRDAYCWGYLEADDKRGDHPTRQAKAERAWEKDRPHLTDDPSVARFDNSDTRGLV